MASDGALIGCVEDDVELRGLLERGLREEGFDTCCAPTAREFVAQVRDRRPDAVVMDIGLPDADGRDVCMALRAAGFQAPVLFLTAHDLVHDRISGFASGGDDYVTKPFSFAEVVARLRALLKRSASAHPTEAVELGEGLALDAATHSVRGALAEVTLSPTEFKLVSCLAAAGGAAVSHDELVRAAWPHGAIVNDNTLHAYIARVRRKLRDASGSDSTITTVPRVGYVLA